MTKDYIVHLNKRQIQLVNMAIEEWLQIRSNQWDMVADDIARCEYRYFLTSFSLQINENDPDNKAKLNAYLQRRDATKVVLKAAMEIAQPNRFRNPVPRSEDEYVLEDIWQVFRHWIQLQNSDENQSSFPFDSSLIRSREPEPSIERKDGEYIVCLNEVQVRLVNTAIEEWFRIRLNQWDMVAEDIARYGYQYNKEDPENEEKFHAYLRRRDATSVVLKAAMEVAQPNRYYNPVPKSEDQVVLEDIWQVLRYEINRQFNIENNKDYYLKTPFIQSGEPEPVVEVIKRKTLQEQTQKL